MGPRKVLKTRRAVDDPLALLRGCDVRPRQPGVLPPTMADSLYDPVRDGITFSLLKSWMDCREMARLNLQGWTSPRSSFALTFGSATHWMLEQVYRSFQSAKTRTVPSVEQILQLVEQQHTTWIKENPTAEPKAREDAEMTAMMLAGVMPVYFEHWHTDATEMRWTRVESEFKVPITIQRPDATYQTFLRGKIDGAFRTEKNGLALFETKTHSRLDEESLIDVLPFDLQTNLYAYVLWVLDKERPRRVLYNVIRRPGLRQGKSEAFEQFSARVAADVRMRPDWYFVRMNVDTDQKEMERFAGELADMLGDFLDWWYGHSGHWKNSNHCQNKYGTCGYLSICGQRSYVGFYKRDKVFRELEEV